MVTRTSSSQEMVVAGDASELAIVGRRVIAEVRRRRYAPQEEFGVRLALEEALLNALVHGCGHDPSKEVRVAYNVEDEHMWIDIEDQGPGFDPSSIPDPTHPAQLRRPHGRGIALMRSYMSSVAFNNRGNRVTMMMQRPSSLRQRVTTLERQNAELRRRNKVLDEFAGTVAHDLSAPVRAVVGYSELLQGALADQIDAENNGLLRTIGSAAKRTQRMLQDLRQLSRLAEPCRKLVDVNEVISEAIAHLEYEVQESEAVVTYDRMPRLLGDRTQLIQLFQNLLSNGLKYCEQRPRIHVSVAAQTGHWKFAVRDNGIGIDPQYRQRVFRPFQRLYADEACYSGSGIGLAICERIVRQHGGTIRIESASGPGSVFAFTLPRRARKVR